MKKEKNKPNRIARLVINTELTEQERIDLKKEFQKAFQGCARAVLQFHNVGATISTQPRFRFPRKKKKAILKTLGSSPWKHYYKLVCVLNEFPNNKYSRMYRKKYSFIAAVNYQSRGWFNQQRKYENKS